MAVTSRPQRAGFPLIWEIGTRGLPKRSGVKISQVRTLAIERVGKRIAALGPEKMARAIDGLVEIIGD